MIVAEVDSSPSNKTANTALDNDIEKRRLIALGTHIAIRLVQIIDGNEDIIGSGTLMTISKVYTVSHVMKNVMDYPRIKTQSDLGGKIHTISHIEIIEFLAIVSVSSFT